MPGFFYRLNEVMDMKHLAALYLTQNKHSIKRYGNDQ